MKTKSKNRPGIKKAQSFLEYSLIIAVTVGVLVIMGNYASRGIQGLLKQHVDKVGGERITSDTYSPGGWYGDGSGDYTRTSKASSWGVDYEHNRRISFRISSGGSTRTEYSRIDVK